MASGMGWELTEENKKQFLIPEGGMAWNDSEIGIQWSKLVGGNIKEHQRQKAIPWMTARLLTSAKRTRNG